MFPILVYLTEEEWNIFSTDYTSSGIMMMQIVRKNLKLENYFIEMIYWLFKLDPEHFEWVCKLGQNGYRIEDLQD